MFHVPTIKTISGKTNFAKYGVTGSTKIMAKELGQHNIRVNAVLPGFVEPAGASAITLERRTEINRMTALGRIGPPKEITNLILFLRSDLAIYCTGSLYDCNGGATL